MKKIFKTLQIDAPAKKVFNQFVNEFNEWWPKEYTWSQDALQEIRIEPKMNGLCTEIGPYGFRCDWGRVTELTENRIGLKWQISQRREPIPNPDKASDVKVSFVSQGDSTALNFEHVNFENHGEGSDDYRNMMDSAQGWDYILNRFKEYCEK